MLREGQITKIMPPLIIAIDPGTVDTGVCLAEGDKLLITDTLHVPKGWKALDRTLAMMDRISEFITAHAPDSQMVHRPESVHVAYEALTTFHGTGAWGEPQARPVISLHQLIALVEYWSRQRGLQTYPYQVNDVKEGIAGSRSAPKHEVETIMRHEYNLHEIQKTNHEWDAISIWTYHLRQLSVSRAMI